MFLRGNLSERDYFYDLGIDGRIVIEPGLKELVVRAWHGLVWLRIVTSVGGF
jgi:hypothetical protein